MIADIVIYDFAMVTPTEGIALTDYVMLEFSL
jgi:hypothetical protein